MIKVSGSYTIRTESGYRCRIFYEWTGKCTSSGERIYVLRSEGGRLGYPNTFDKGTLITETQLLAKLSPSDLV